MANLEIIEYIQIIFIQKIVDVEHVLKEKKKLELNIKQ